MLYNPINNPIILKDSHILTFYDKVIILALIILALGSLFFFKYHKNIADIILIEVNGKEALKANLNKDTHLFIDGAIGKTEIEIKDRRVRIVNSPCKGKLCVHAKWIAKPYQTIICVPNRVIISFANSNEGKPIDAITR